MHVIGAKPKMHNTETKESGVKKRLRPWSGLNREWCMHAVGEFNMVAFLPCLHLLTWLSLAFQVTVNFTSKPQ
mgnify:CR=1 FL=1